MPLVAKRAGYSAILMNLEHMAMSMETMKDIAVSCLNVGITPTVVVPTCAPEWISRCLDSGAQTIIVPHVNNVEQARMCVDASKFPPLVRQTLCAHRLQRPDAMTDSSQGHRSVTMVSAMTQYTTELSYATISEVVNNEVMIMPMIESQEGVDNVEEIAAVPGIDALFIGCADLCMELGIPGQYDTELFHSTVAKVAAAAEKASAGDRKVFVGLGGLEPRPDLLSTFAKRHAPIRFAMAGRDLALLMTSMTQQAAKINSISTEL
ncbi:HpcH/HpaI aldolase/citrate lyase family [Geosmithia morbida]|uniref:HpcH/HpaI aldolase/citrate lyase family n=1 Tax=Geosmithia morbida TaxID=1094350 RepID=A0A9P5D2G5_9HYPO|nr:HpcH/HpaI aldolase/citrate lyase family [Geosmithia morbida]KAF4121456.1 HpcH/HpaI aldolase/citrate lyase family [Geosmithia morbida]